MAADAALIEDVAREARDRLELWTWFLNCVRARRVAEIGVFRGTFAARILAACPAIETYYMIDPWRHLEDWNKPANRPDDVFEQIFAEALEKTEAHAARRAVLRGRTTEVVGDIPDASLDFAYVDGDHTLRGITTDLIRIYPKVGREGWIGGDDFSPSIWQHGGEFEPTFVFPFALYFAEAVGARLYGLPRGQFLLEKASNAFEFVDLTGRYERRTVLDQLRGPPRRSIAYRLAQAAKLGRRGRAS